MKKGMSRSEVRSDSSKALKRMREAGIKFVEVLGSGCAEDDCESCRAFLGQKLEIEFATPLPLPDCDKQFCKCIYIAKE